MAYTIPTADDLKTAFPVFDDVPDETVEIWIDRASRSADETWAEDDYAWAIELLACHYMVENGLGTSAEAKMYASGMSGFSTVKSGQLTLQRGATSRSETVPAPWGSTWYGQQFYWLLRRNRPAVTVANSPYVDEGYNGPA